MTSDFVQKEIEKACRHNVGFQLFTKNGDAAFICLHRCGYALNFDPELFPGGVAYVDKQGNPALFRLKEVIKMVSSKRG